MYFRATCCLLVLTVLVLGISVYIAVHTPLSLLYRSFHSDGTMRNQVAALNSNRYQKAVEHIRTLETQLVTRPFGSTASHDKPDIVIAIVTVARTDSIGNGYLTQTVASLDKLLVRDNNFRRKLLFICNVDKHPGNHAEAIQLQNKFHFIQKHGVNSLGIRVYNKPKMLNTGLVDTTRIRETEDYVFCLNASYSLNSKYVLILEDDVLPHRHVLDVINFTLHRKLSDSVNSLLKINISNFAYLKLYYPLKWQGFALEIDKLMEFVCLTVIGGSIMSGLLSCFKIRCGRSSVYSYTCVYLYGVIISSALLLLIGRVNTDGWRRLSPQLYKLEPSSACCTQAMLYNSSVIPQLMNHLLVNNSLNKDLAIYEFSEKNGLPGLQLEPNLFLHSGLSTSLSTERKDPEEFLFDMA